MGIQSIAAAGMDMSSYQTKLNAGESILKKELNLEQTCASQMIQSMQSVGQHLDIRA